MKKSNKIFIDPSTHRKKDVVENNIQYHQTIPLFSLLEFNIFGACFLGAEGVLQFQNAAVSLFGTGAIRISLCRIGDFSAGECSSIGADDVPLQSVSLNMFSIFFLSQIADVFLAEVDPVNRSTDDPPLQCFHVT